MVTYRQPLSLSFIMISPSVRRNRRKDVRIFRYVAEIAKKQSLSLLWTRTVTWLIISQETRAGAPATTCQ